MNRTATVMRGLLALLVLVGLVVGLPLALLAVAGSPIPDSLPDPARLWDTLTSQDDGTVLLEVLQLAAWAGWALFTASVLSDLVARARHVRVPHLGPQQALASHLVAAVAALAVLSPTAAAAAPAPFLFSLFRDISDLAFEYHFLIVPRKSVLTKGQSGLRHFAL